MPVALFTPPEEDEVVDFAPPSSEAFVPPEEDLLVDAAYSDLAPESAAASAARNFKAKILPAIGTAVGGAAAGLVATPESVGLATIPAAIAGGALGGAAGEKGYEYLMGDEAAKRERAQIALNEQAHPWASTAGGAIPTLLSLIGGGGLVKTVGAKAAKGLEGAAAQEAIKKATSGVGTKIAEASLTGARLGASTTAQRAVQGDDVGVADFADAMAHDAVAFGPFGVLPHVEQLGKAMGMAIPQAYLSTIAGAAYDSMVHGQPFDAKDIAGKGTAEVVPFAIFNAISHGVQAGQKRMAHTAAQRTVTTAADSAQAAGMPQTAQVLRDLAAKAQAQTEARKAAILPEDIPEPEAPVEEASSPSLPLSASPPLQSPAPADPFTEPPAAEPPHELSAPETPEAPPGEPPQALPGTPDEAEPGTVLSEPQKPGGELPPVEQPQPPISPDVLRGTHDLTPEAETILAQVDAGGAAPAFITPNLERIAKENGIEVTGSMRPSDVVEALRAKKTHPIEPQPHTPDALPQPEAGALLQREPQETGISGSERLGVEPGQPGQEAAAPSVQEAIAKPELESPAKASADSPSSTLDVSDSAGQDKADDRPAGLFKLEYRDENDLSEPEQRALESITGSRTPGSIRPVEARPLVQVGEGEGAEGNRYREALKEVFGKTVLFVEAVEGPELGFDAASPPSARNVILMDARTTEPVLHLTGHELVHALKAQQPELWTALRNDLLALAGDWTAHREALAELGYGADKMEDEFLGDFVGNQFRNPDFWKRASERNPTLFGRLARAALDILNKLIDRAKGLGRNVEGYFSDLHAAREVVLDALEKYSKGPMPERDMPVGADVDYSLKGAEPPEEDAPPEKVAGFYNAAMDAERERLGMAVAERAPYMSVEDLHSASHRELVADPTKPERILDEMEETKRPVTAEEDALLRQYGIELQLQLDSAPEGENDPRHAVVYDKLDRLLRNVIASGSRQGQAFRMRQTLLDHNFEVAGLARRWMAITGKSLTPEEWAHIRKEAQEFKELNDADKQAAYNRLKKTSQDEIERLHEELKAKEEASSGWLDEALDALDDADRQNVDAVLKEVQFLHELATQSAASGIDFSLKADQRTAANRARLEGARARVAALGKLTPEVVAKAKAEASARLAKLRKTFADPATTEAIDKAVGGDRTALKLLESLKQKGSAVGGGTAATPARPKPVDAVKKRFADEARKPGPVEKFVADLTAAGVSKENAEKLHVEAIKKSERLTKERAARKVVRQAVGEDPESNLSASDSLPLSPSSDPVTPLDELKQTFSAGEKDIAKVPVSLLRNAVRSLVASGLRGDEQVMPALTKLVNDSGIKATEEQVRERAVDYGHAPTPTQDEPDKSTREALAEALKVASIRRVEHGDAPLKTGQQRDKPHQKLRELFKVLKDKMKAAGIMPRTSEQQLASVEDATLTRLRNDIEDLQAQIEAGQRKVRDKTPASHTQKFVDEQTRLKAEKQKLVEALDSIDPAKPMSAEEREKLLIRAAERSAEHWRDRIKNAEWEERAKTGPPSQKVLAAREIAAHMKELFEQARDLARPDLKKDPESLMLARYNRLLDRREADLSRRLREKDYSKPIRRETVLDDATAKRKIEFERKLRAFNADAREAADKNRTPSQKFWDYMVKMKRSFVLTYPAVIGKLTAASLTRGFTTMGEELAGGAMGKLLPSDFTTGKDRARIEGGVLKAAGYVQAAKNWHMKWIDDMKKTFSLGSSDLDVMLGKEHEKPDVWGLPGRIHAAIKAPIKRALYEFAMAKQIQSYLEDGHDPADLRDGELLHMRMADKAYKYAERGIFLQDNQFVKSFNAFVKSNELAKGTVGPGMARLVRVLMPIVKVPTNIIAESFQMVGGLPVGLVRLARAWHTGFDKLTSDERESILRTMKKGSLGAGLVLFGYYSNNPAFQAGGYYNHDDKRKPGDPKAGGFKLFGVEIPHWLTHAPAFEAIQFGATIRRAQNNTKHGSALPPATMAALMGLAEETPFLNEMFRIKDLQTETGRGKFFAELAKAQVVPGLVQQAAAWSDRARPLEPQDLLTGDGTQARKPNGFTEIIESGIPGLRQKLSYKVDSPFSPRRAEEIPEVLHQYAQHGNPMPSLPERTPLEKKVGHPLTNAVWNAYTDIRGRAIEREMLSNIGYLSSPADEKEKKRRVMEIARQASYEARQALGLTQ